MKKQNRWFAKVSFIIALVFAINLQAQDLDDLEDSPSNNDVPCLPDDISTPYEYLGATELSENDVKLKFSYLADYSKKQNWSKVREYGWALVYGDKQRRFKSIYDKLADSYYYENHADSALMVCQMGIKDVGDRTRLHYYAAIIQFQLGRYHCAETSYQFLAEKSPDHVDYWRYLTRAQMKQDKESAIESQEKVVDLTNNDPKEVQLLGELYERFGRNPLNAYMESWNQDPTLANLNLAKKIGRMAKEQGREDEGLVVVENALALAPDDAELYLLKAGLHQTKMQYSASIEAYKTYLKKAPGDMDAYCAVADIYREMRNWSAARSYARQAIDANSNSGKPRIVLGNIYQEAASDCLNKDDGQIKIDHKLVFEMAYNEYARAAKDPGYASEARTKMQWLRSSQLMPSEEDRFLHPNVKKPRLACFSWI
jgi:tetratricopeptide (TPR) repeat protein